MSNRLSNRFDNRLYRVYKHSTGCETRLTTSLTNGCIVYTAGCQTGCTTRFDNRLNEQWMFIQHGCQSGCHTRLTTGLTTGCIVYANIQPVVKLDSQPVVSCKRGISRHSSCSIGSRFLRIIGVLHYGFHFPTLYRPYMDSCRKPSFIHVTTYNARKNNKKYNGL